MDVKIHPFSVFTAMAEPDVFDPYEVLGVSADATLEDTLPAKSVRFSGDSIDSTSIIINQPSKIWVIYRVKIHEKS